MWLVAYNNINDEQFKVFQSYDLAKNYVNYLIEQKLYSTIYLAEIKETVLTLDKDKLSILREANND